MHALCPALAGAHAAALSRLIADTAFDISITQKLGPEGTKRLSQLLQHIDGPAANLQVCVHCFSV